MSAGEQPVLEEEIRGLLDRGDSRQAVTRAIEGYGPQILGYLEALLRDKDRGREAFSEFSEELWKGIGNYRRASPFRTWMYGIAWNVVKRQDRRERRRRTRRLETTEFSRIAQAVCSRTASYLQTAARDRLAAVRERLDPQEHTLLILRVDRGLSWKEVAQVMSSAENPLDDVAARKRFLRIKDKIRRLAAGEHRRQR